MYIYSDYKAKITQARRNSPTTKNGSFYGTNEMKRTVSVEKLNLKKEYQFVQSPSVFSYRKNSKNPTVSSKNPKTIVTNFSDSGKSKKNSSLLNFNSYNDNYVNWVNGIKNFSSSKCEKKWQNFQSNIKSLKDTPNNNIETEKIGTLQINKFEPGVDEEEYVISRRLNNKMKNNVIKFSSNKPSECIESIEKSSNYNDYKYQTIPDKLNGKNDFPSDTSILHKSTLTNNHNNISHQPTTKERNIKSNLKNSISTSNIPLINNFQSSSNINNRDGLIKNVRIIYSKIRKSGNNELNPLESNRESLNDEKKDNNIYINTENNDPVKEMSDTKLKTFKNEKLVESFHKNLIDRKLKAKFEQTKIDSMEKPHLQYVDNKFESIKNKVLLMKGVFDYVYPKVVMKKTEDITNKIKLLKEKEKSVNQKPNKNDHSFLIENSAFHIKNVNSKKIGTENWEKERCHSLGKTNKRSSNNSSIRNRDSILSKIKNRKIKQSSK